MFCVQACGQIDVGYCEFLCISPMFSHCNLIGLFLTTGVVPIDTSYSEGMFSWFPVYIPIKVHLNYLYGLCDDIKIRLCEAQNNWIGIYAVLVYVLLECFKFS